MDGVNDRESVGDTPCRLKPFSVPMLFESSLFYLSFFFCSLFGGVLCILVFSLLALSSELVNHLPFVVEGGEERAGN